MQNETGAQRSRDPPLSCARILKLKPKLGRQECGTSLTKNLGGGGILKILVSHTNKTHTDDYELKK